MRDNSISGKDEDEKIENKITYFIIITYKYYLFFIISY